MRVLSFICCRKHGLRTKTAFDVCRKYANLMKRGRGISRAPLLWLQRVKRLAIAYHNHNRNHNCGGGKMWGIKIQTDGDFDFEGVV